MTFKWHSSSFTPACTSACGQNAFSQTRTVVCRSVSDQVIVADQNCAPPKPTTTGTCEATVQCSNFILIWKHSPSIGERCITHNTYDRSRKPSNVCTLIFLAQYSWIVGSYGSCKTKCESTLLGMVISKSLTLPKKRVENTSPFVFQKTPQSKNSTPERSFHSDMTSFGDHVTLQPP